MADWTGTRKRRTDASDLGVLWWHAMQEFVRQQNIAEFRRLLTVTADEYQWRVLLKLLAEEEAKAPHPVKAPDDD